MAFLKDVIKTFYFLLIAGIGVTSIIASGGNGSSTTSSSSSNSSSSDGNVTFTAEIQNLSIESSSMNLYRSVNITPSVYKIALVNFWFIKDDNTEVNILNPDSNNPTYTEDNPLVIDFSSLETSRELLSGVTLETGTYTGYKMQFLYLEMRLHADFHLPDISQGDEFPSGISTDIMDDPAYYDFRLYFNAMGKYWKRDFVAELDAGTDEWFWMRRAVEDGGDEQNFFIAVADNTHPPGGSAPTSTIDLFADDEFWGAEEDYSNSDDPIIVGTHSTAGGVDANLDDSFTIGDGSYEITLYVDVGDTMNYSEDGTAPAGVTFTENVLDLGPGYGADLYGDQGLHPFVPRFSVDVE